MAPRIRGLAAPDRLTSSPAGPATGLRQDAADQLGEYQVRTREKRHVAESVKQDELFGRCLDLGEVFLGDGGHRVNVAVTVHKQDRDLEAGS